MGLPVFPSHCPCFSPFALPFPPPPLSQVTSRHMGEEHLKELRAVFESMDEDGSGGLSLDELREGLRRVGAHMSEEEVQRTFEFVSITFISS